MNNRFMTNERKIFAILAVMSCIVGLAIFFLVHGGVIRNYGGDAIAVTFIYSLLSSVFRFRPYVVAGMVWTVAILIEMSQLVIRAPNLAISSLAFGSTFDFIDIYVYTLTLLVIFIVHRLWLKKNQSKRVI